MITEAQLASAVQCPLSRASLWLLPLQLAMARHGITTKLRAAFFLGQLGHESLSLSRTEENLNYSAQRLLEVFERYFTKANVGTYARQPQKIANRVYANRMGNGDELSGDGWRYRGRCPIQLTGLDNYRWLGGLTGLPLVDQPDTALELQAGADIAAAYWQGTGLNALADANDVLGVSRKINFGTVQTTKTPHGLADRIERTKRAKAALGVA